MSNGASVELAPLRGSFEINLDDLQALDEQLSDLKDNLEGLGSNIEFTSNIDSLVSELTGSLDTLQNITEEEMDVFNSFGGAVQEINNALGGLNSKIDDLESAFESSGVGIKSASEEMADSLNDLEMKLQSLRGLADIKGVMNIEGIGETQIELDGIQQSISDLMAKAINLNDTLEMTDDDFEDLQERASNLSGATFDLQNHVEGLGENFEEGSEKSEAFGENMRESGMNTLWTGQMISSMLSPVRTLGETMFKLGLQSSSAMEVTTRMFGRGAKSVQQWCETSVNSMGLAGGEALKNVEQFGLSAKSLGANNKQAIELAEGYTELAQHINLGTQGTITYQEASQACLAAMAGSTSQLKRLGISFTNSAENAESAALGYGKVYKNLTPVQQATVRLKLAQKDLNKEFGTTKQDLTTNYGKWEKTKAQFESVAETLGEKLVPIILTVAKDISNLATWFTHLGKGAQTAILAIGGILTIAGPIVEAIGLIKLAIGGATKAAELFQIVMDMNPIILAITAVVATAVLLYEAWKHNWGGIRTTTKKVMKDIVKEYKKFKNDIFQKWDQIKTGIEDKWNELCSWFSKNVVKPLKNAKSMFDNFLNMVKSKMESIKSYFSNKWNELCSWFSSNVVKPLENAKSMFDNFLNMVESKMESIKSYFLNKWNELCSWFSSNVVKPLENAKSMFDNFFSMVESKMEAIKSYFINKWEALCSWFSAMVIRPLQDAKSMFESFLSVVTSKMESVKTYFLNKWEALCSWFSSEVREPLDYIRNMFDNFVNVVSNKMESAKEYFLNKWEALCSWFSSEVLEPVQFLETMGSDFISTISSFIHNAVSSFSNGWNDLCSWFSGEVIQPVQAVVSMGSNFISSIENFIQSAFSGFSNGWNNLCSWFSGVANEPVQEISNIFGDMEQAGADLIHNLLNGIEGAWHSVTSWISNELSGLASSVESAASHIVGDITGSDGSHATGLGFVPWDGYRAELHKGEMVLTADQANEYRNGSSNSNSSNTYNFYSPEPIDAFQARNQLEQLNRNIANGFV